MKNKARNWTKWLYWFMFAVAIIFVYKTLDNFNDIINWFKELFSILMPFFVGALLAYLFYIPSRKVESIYKKINIPNKLSRLLSIITVYIIAILIIIVLINVILPAIYESVIELSNNFPGYYENIMNFINDLPEDSIISKDTLLEAVDKIKNTDFASYFSVDKILEYLKGVVSLARGIFSVFVSIIVSVYILLQRRDILEFMQKFCRAMFKEDTCKTLGNYFTKANDVFFKFISSQLIDAVIVGIITSVAMSIMGVRYALLLGFIIGLFNIIPYFGAIVGVGITILVTWVTGGITQAIWVAVVIIILQQIDANIINPKIVGDSLSLSPILVIFAVTVGGAYFNFLGMLLGVPIIAIIKILVCDFVDYKSAKKKLNESKIE